MMEITLPFLTTANLLQASLPPPNHCEFINIWLKIWFVHNKISEMPDTISAKHSKILKQQLNLICKHHTPWQPIKSISMQVRFILNAMKDSCWSAIVLLGNWCSPFHSNRDIKNKPAMRQWRLTFPSRHLLLSVFLTFQPQAYHIHQTHHLHADKRMKQIRFCAMFK